MNLISWKAMIAKLQEKQKQNKISQIIVYHYIIENKLQWYIFIIVIHSETLTAYTMYAGMPNIDFLW